MSEARVKRLIKLDKCRCERKTCFQKLPTIVAELLRFLHIFWTMTKSAQDLFVQASAVPIIVWLRPCCSAHNRKNSLFLSSRYHRLWALASSYAGGGFCWGNACLRNVLQLVWAWETSEYLESSVGEKIGVFESGEESLDCNLEPPCEIIWIHVDSDA